MIGAGLAPREVEREARRLLPHLRRAALSPTERGDFRAGAGPRADRRLVAALAARGLIVAQAGGTYALSVEGEAFLRRAGGGETAFLAQHAELTREGDALRARAVDAIEWLQARGLLTDAESDAAARLAQDYERAALEPRVTADWSAPVGEARRVPDPGAGPAAAAIAARRRVEAALEAAGPDFANLLVEICCRGRSLGEMEAEAGWPRRAGRVVLKLALGRLALHFGLAPSGRPRPIEAWRAAADR